MKYTWADVMKTVLGIQQQQEGIRRAALIIHCSLVEKKYRVDFSKFWPIPFDEENEETLPGWNAAQMRLLKKHKQKEAHNG